MAAKVRARVTSVVAGLTIVTLWCGRLDASEPKAGDHEYPAAPSVSHAPAPPVPATDSEEPAPPSRQARTLPQSSFVSPGSVEEDDTGEEPTRPRNPVLGLMLEVGIGGGGDDLARVSLSDGSHETLSAGDGISVSVGLMVTPFWLRDRLGVGLSGTIGYKGWSVGGSNGDIRLGRYPVTAAVHVLPRVAKRWLLMARGGIDKEFNVSISGSGDLSGPAIDLTAGLGGFGEVGFYKIMNTREQRGAWSLTFRYTKLTYSANGATADAASLMVYSALYYNP